MPWKDEITKHRAIQAVERADAAGKLHGKHTRTTSGFFGCALEQIRTEFGVCTDGGEYGDVCNYDDDAMAATGLNRSEATSIEMACPGLFAGSTLAGLLAVMKEIPVEDDNQ